MPFKTEGPDRLKTENIGKVFYDGQKAYTVAQESGHLTWRRLKELDVERKRERETDR